MLARTFGRVLLAGRSSSGAVMLVCSRSNPWEPRRVTPQSLCPDEEGQLTVACAIRGPLYTVASEDGGVPLGTSVRVERGHGPRCVMTGVRSRIERTCSRRTRSSRHRMPRYHEGFRSFERSRLFIEEDTATHRFGEVYCCGTDGGCIPIEAEVW